MIPLLPFEPDKGPFSPNSTDSVMNVLPVINGWGPMPSLESVSDSLGAQCRGGIWYRNTAGNYGFIAATADKLYRLGSDGSWDHVSKLSADQVTNGTFASDTGWSKGTGVTISGGVAVFTAVGDGFTLAQSQSFTASTIYKITFTVSGYSAGGVRPVIAGGTAVNGTTRSANGTYTEYLKAVTGNNVFRLTADGVSTTLNVDNVTVEALVNYALADGHLWQFDIFGTRLFATHLNDPLQVIDIDTGTEFADASGSPPQAKFIRTIGDFLFLAHLKVGSDTFPKRWHNSAINDTTGWTVGTDSSDRQDVPDGGEITGIIPMTGGARLLQQSAKRALIFTPGSSFAFQQTDIDATRGVQSPYATVAIGSNDYFYLNETGFYRGDVHKPIGAERVDDYFFGDVNLSKIEEVQGAIDPYYKMVWISYENQAGERKMLGYNWQLDRWTPSDIEAEYLVTAVIAGQVLDDLGILDTVDFPLGSPVLQGGDPSFGAFTSSNELSYFGGASLAATLETSTIELNPDSGSFVTGARLKGNATSYAMQVGKSTLPDEAPEWSAPSVRSSRTGLCPFRSDGKHHRFRVNIDAGGAWTHVHGISVEAQPSGAA